MSIVARFSSAFLATITKAADVANVTQKIDEPLIIDYTNGSGASQANTIYAKQRTLGASASEDLDLTGTLTDALGDAVNNVRIKGIRIITPKTNPASMTFGAAASNAWATLLNATGTITLPPGTVFEVFTESAAGWPVTAGTGDLLKVASGAGGTSTYIVVFLGASS